MRQLHHMLKMDKTDEEILDAIRFDAKLSNRQIAKKTGIPMATVNRRLRELLDTGIIRRFVTELDHEKLGKKTIAYILIRAKAGANQRQMIREISKMKEVEDIASLAGQFDLLIKVRVKDNEELTDFLFNKMKILEQVSQTETLIALNIKDES